MPRNLERRVEILFPVEDPHLRKQLWHILEGQLRDTAKAQILQSDGTYEKIDRRGKELFCAQDAFCQEAVIAGRQEETGLDKRIFIPKMHVEQE